MSVSNQAFPVLMHLMRKDGKQIFPLLVLLSVVAFALTLFPLIASNNSIDRDSLSEMVLAGLPSLFAVGAGAMLVGQEKDQRTMQWLRALPIRKKELILSKLFVALLSLALVWLISFSLYRLGRFAMRLPADYGTIPVPVVLLNTLFLILSSLALSWKLPTSFTGLLAIVPIAFLPFACSLGVDVLLEQGHFPDSSSAVQRAGMLGFWSLVLFAFGWRNAYRFLSAMRAPTHTQATAHLSSSALENTHWTYRAPQSQGFAMIRQFALQNRIALIVLGSLLFLTYYGVGCVSSQSKGTFFRDRMILWSMSLLATSWLGVLAFHGDQLHQRIRFLADRGVSPWLVWKTRHAVPLMLMVLTSVGYLLAQLLTRNSPLDLYNLSSFAGMMAAILTTYVFAQWIGQWSPSPILAAIVAPACIPASVTYVMVVFQLAGMWAWPVVPAFAFGGLFATANQMKRWMDQNVGWRFHLNHTLWLLTCLAIPLLSGAVGILASPSMPRERERQLIALAQGIPVPNTRPKLFMDRDMQSQSIDQVEKSQLESISEYIRNYPIDDANVVRFLAQQLIYYRPTIDSSDSEKTTYRNRFELVTRTSTATSQGTRLIEQSVSDAIEMLLLHELSLPNAENILGTDLYLESLQRIANGDRRNNARRMAIAIALKELEENASPEIRGLGGYPFLGYIPYFLNNDPLTKRSLRGNLSLLYDLLEARTPEQIANARKAIDADWRKPYATFGDLEELPLNFTLLLDPAFTWHGDWEKKANQLLETRKSSKGAVHE